MKVDYETANVKQDELCDFPFQVVVSNYPYFIGYDFIHGSNSRSAEFPLEKFRNCKIVSEKGMDSRCKWDRLSIILLMYIKSRKLPIIQVEFVSEDLSQQNNKRKKQNNKLEKQQIVKRDALSTLQCVTTLHATHERFFPLGKLLQSFEKMEYNHSSYFPKFLGEKYEIPNLLEKFNQKEQSKS
eukprot:Pgem_evm1s1512